MAFTHLPLLEIQRELLDIPRGFERFKEYLKKMVYEDEIFLPLQNFNPMSKEHVAGVLDKLLEIEAEAGLVHILEDVFAQNYFGAQNWKIGLVVSDDLKGGWTSRPFMELERLTCVDRVVYREFMPLIWWASDALGPSEFSFRLRRQLYEISCLIRGEKPMTLLEILELKKQSALFADPKSLGKTTEGQIAFEKLEPYFQERNTGTLITCLSGDEAGSALGYPPLGINAGEAEEALAWLNE